jgi:UDP-N-acetylmuramoyl-tripeptide--D-alanyl-D-alanine ligase
MKEILKKITIVIITLEARLILWRYKPKIIAISGTVGKTTTKDMIYTALTGSLNIRKNKKSLNSEFGVPLTIIGSESGWSSSWKWLQIIFNGFIRIFYVENYPAWLVLEVGIDHPGDMKKTARWLKPDVAVFTTYGEIPVHVEFFDSPEGVMEEQTKLLNYVKNDGFILVNADDKNVLKIKNKSHVKAVTYSLTDENVDFYASNYQVAYDKETNKPKGMAFKVNYSGKVFPINLKGVLGEQYIYPVLISLAIADSIEVSVVDVLANLANFEPVPGRIRIIEGLENSVILDDTYNASPVAVQKALNILKEIETPGKRIAVLGDMLELGRYTASEHKKVGELVCDLKIDILIAVGLRAETIAEKALELGMNKEKVFMFRKSEETIELVKNLISANDIVLVKGSQGIRMEKIVVAIMKNPEQRTELLARQEKEWVGR